MSVIDLQPIEQQSKYISKIIYTYTLHIQGGMWRYFSNVNCNGKKYTSVVFCTVESLTSQTYVIIFVILSARLHF